VTNLNHESILDWIYNHSGEIEKMEKETSTSMENEVDLSGKEYLIFRLVFSVFA